MASDGEPRDLQVLTINETIYGEDYLIEDLKRQGKTERTSGFLASLLGRLRKNQVPGVRQTPTGNTLRLVRVEPGEVVDDNKEDK